MNVLNVMNVLKRNSFLAQNFKTQYIT